MVAFDSENGPSPWPGARLLADAAAADAADDPSEGEAATELVEAFWDVVAAWRLTLGEQLALAGVDRATLYAWRQGDVSPLAPDVAARLAQLIEIHAGLRARLPRPERAHEWLRKPHRSSLLAGTSPLQHVLGGSGDALGTVARLIGASG